MAKKILAIFFVSILLCSYIIPATSAFADVVIGDNDSYAVTELGVENGKKIATMEAMLQLLESGVSQIDFNDISDLDDYLEDFYDELTNINAQDISNAILAGAYNDVKELKNWIDDRGEYIATYYKDFLNSADEGLSNIFNDFQLKLPKSKLVGTSLNGFRSLSRFNSGNTPNPDLDYQFYLDFINGSGFFFANWTNRLIDNTGGNNTQFYPYYNYSYVSTDATPPVMNGTGSEWQSAVSSGIIDVYITSLNGEYFYSYNSTNIATGYYYGSPMYGIQFRTNNQGNPQYIGPAGAASGNYTYTSGNFSSLTELFSSLERRVKNVNIYVDGDAWSIVSDSNIPTLNIDGIIKLYGNDNPIQYEFPQGTQIDYNALYTTIYNAIRDNLPLDMQTVNNNQVYYDSHDTVYSPTIYNYYGKDGDDENDWIDSILDYATIPDFNSVLGTVAVLDAPFVNGVTIVNAGVTNVIPTDILLIFGGFFVLVLFVCIINRMSE